MKDKITQAVINDLRSRSIRGIGKYKTTLSLNNSDDFMKHLYEELLDAAQYCKKEQSIIPEIQELIRNHPNNAELGTIIRTKYGTPTKEV